MAKNHFHRVDKMFEMISWTPHEEKVLIDLLRQSKLDGILVSNDLQGDALFDITSKLSSTLGKEISFKKVAKKFKALSDRYDQWEKVHNVLGVKINRNELKLEADEATWATILKDNPSALKYKHQCEPLLIELNMVFGQLKREEDMKKTNEFRRGLARYFPSPNCVANTSHHDRDIVSDERSVVGGYNKHVLPLSTPSVYDPSFGIYKDFVGTSHVGKKMERFDDDYVSDMSQFSSVGSCMGP